MDSEHVPSEPEFGHFRLAGFALAHALWSIETGGTLCTLAFVASGDARQLIRFEADSIATSVAIAKPHLTSVMQEADRAALVYDGYVTIDDVRTDALIVELIVASGAVSARLVQRYRPARLGLLGLLRAVRIPAPGGVRVIGLPTAQDELPHPAAAALTEGIAEHPVGRRLFRL